MSDNLKTIYIEILQGYSFLPPGFFIKHISNVDLSEIEQFQSQYFQDAVDQGISTEQERLQYLYANGIWTPENESDLAGERRCYENIRLSLTKLFKKLDIDGLTAQSIQIKNKIDSLEIQKRNLIGYTAELYSHKKVNEYYVFSTLYKDKKLTKRYYKRDTFDDLEEEELDKIIKKYNTIMIGFEDRNIQKIAISGFFLNYFYLCSDNPFFFYGKYIAYLTNNQINLFHNGLKFKNIISEMRDKVAADVLNDPEKLLAAYNMDKNLDEITGKMVGDKNIGIVGLSKEEMQKVANKTGARIVDYKAAARAKGKGSLTMNELLEMD